MLKVSVIIPSYNSLKYLDETIESVLKQTYNNIEIILIDDGSTDGTREQFSRFEKYGIKCISQSNAGASTARNTGLDYATGEYIQFLDADDLIDAQKIEKQVIEMQKKDADISYTRTCRFNTKTNKKFEHFSLTQMFERTGEEMLLSYGADNWSIPIHPWLTKVELIKKAGYWNPKISNNDDGEFFSRVLFWAKRVVFVEGVFAHYRISDNDSLSKLNSESKMRSAYISVKLISDLLLTYQKKEMLRYAQNGFYSLFLIAQNSNLDLSTQIANEFDILNKLWL